MEKYNGWKNRATWNVALYINNEYSLYSSAVAFMKKYNGRQPYKAFIKYMSMENERTPDRFKYLSNSLCYRELNSMMIEFREE